MAAADSFQVGNLVNFLIVVAVRVGICRLISNLHSFYLLLLYFPFLSFPHFLFFYFFFLRADIVHLFGQVVRLYILSMPHVIRPVGCCVRGYVRRVGRGDSWAGAMGDALVGAIHKETFPAL